MSDPKNTSMATITLPIVTGRPRVGNFGVESVCFVPKELSFSYVG